jgi:epoxyqueuosine reductase
VPALSLGLAHAAPTVRGHAAWALGQIGGEGARAALLAARTRETDADTVEEMERALGQLSGMDAPEGRVHA